MSNIKTIITGTGSYIPQLVKTNKEFTVHQFYAENNLPIEQAPDVIIQKFSAITGIEERRYADEKMNASDMAAIAAREAIADSGIDPETLDQVIVGQNFGDVYNGTIQTDNVPSIAARVKHALKIVNPDCVAYDVIFGCPGWLQGLIQANAYFKAGVAQKCLVIGAETLSRVIDDYDRDSMIFSDGAGACVVEAVAESTGGILSQCAQSHCGDEATYINMGKSNRPQSDERIRYIKMKGRKVYEYAMKHVPLAMKKCIDLAGVSIGDIRKIFIHQANEKMDEGIIRELYKLYSISNIPDRIMPMSIKNLGNSSVATIPTLYDMVIKGKLEGHQIESGDVVLFASVGAGMHINAVCYRLP
jgi:3-oxoacyl-[acyl-carrier-protein] synthase III